MNKVTSGSPGWRGLQDKQEREETIRALAQATSAEEGLVEFDDDAPVSEGGDNGAYVQAWVWVSFAGTKLDKEPMEEAEPEQEKKGTVCQN